MIIERNGVASYFYSGDSLHHTIVATSDGIVHEIWHDAGEFLGTAPLGQPFAPGTIVAVAGFAQFGDNHAIVAQSDGTVTELYWQPGQGVNQDPLGQFEGPPLTAMNAYVTADDFAHVIVALGPFEGNAGNVQQIRYSPAAGINTYIVGLLPEGLAANAVAGYEDRTPSGQGVETIWVATDDSNIRVVQFRGGGDLSGPPLPTWGTSPGPAITGISAFADSAGGPDGCYVNVFVTPDVVGSILTSTHTASNGTLSGVCFPAGGPQWTGVPVVPTSGGDANPMTALSAYQVGAENFVVYPEGNNVFLAKRADPPHNEFDPWNRSYLGTF